eukprot:7199823-Alexandrium_andersonii.AAC.1
MGSSSAAEKARIATALSMPHTCSAHAVVSAVHLPFPPRYVRLSESNGYSWHFSSLASTPNLGVTHH